MIVVIDAGNSAVKIALADESGVHLEQTVPTATVLEYRGRAGAAKQIVADAAAKRADAVLLVSVVPRWTAAIRQAAEDLNIRLIVADHSTIPIQSRLRNPAGVGSDRLLDAYAAARLHGTPTIVVDLGTATTVDAVDVNGAFVGGAILPGIELAMRALSTGTAQLPQVHVTELPHAIGGDTEGAIASGVIFGQIGAVRELVERIAVELSPGDLPRATVVVTGGTSRASWSGVWLEQLGDRPPVADIVDPDLTLRGLALLHEELAGMPA